MTGSTAEHSRSPFSCGARYPWGEIALELQVEEGVCRDAAV